MGLGTFRRRYRIFFAFTGVILIAGAVVIFSKDIFRIEHIEVVGQDIGIDIDINKLERNLLFFPSEKLQAQLLAEYPVLSAVKIRKKFPQTLQISVVKRVPFAVIESEGQMMTIDKDAVVLGNFDPKISLIPIRVSVGTLRIGQVLKDPRVRAALTFISAMQSDLPIALVAENPDASMQAYGRETNILFPQDDSIASRSATLQRLIAGFRIKGKLPALIDLRFDKPVIKN